MRIYKIWQRWLLEHPSLSTMITIAGVVLNIVGLGGTRDDLEGWSDFLFYVYEYVPSMQIPSFPSDWGRWMFVIFGMLLIFLANDIPGKLAQKWGHLRSPPKRMVTEISGRDAITKKYEPRINEFRATPELGHGDISIMPSLGAGEGSVCAKFTNMTPRAVKNCRYSLSNLQRWSDIQKTYLHRSKSFAPIYIPGRKTLEPEDSEGLELFSNRNCHLSIFGRRNDRAETVYEKAELNSTSRITVSVSGGERLINEKRVCFQIVGANKLALVPDPESEFSN